MYYTMEKSCWRKKNFDRRKSVNGKKKRKITDTKFHISDEANGAPKTITSHDHPWSGTDEHERRTNSPLNR